ncbi:sine oculis-binding protein homolog isoform X1 [Bombyx mori]|uniref:Sine oculis-binding protein homolog n=2 Tax=Bombyx mori TaxID=7091 RepID=A0A8R2HLL5_BOMMO|nr:sine oculis-binding protein homolog [Bombyx mori]
MDNNSSTKTPPLGVKKENEEEIKDFAETAMNELLGWYGYERLELRRWAASRAKDASSPEQSNEQKNKDECSWCNKGITSESGALQHAGATFCSELCFSQSRRANFKRAKTCDWCRHVRHTVAYVDFQDGATQLQFCSDKCLNQYKMHIFCRETQAHLDLNPHLVNASSSSNLITPELWLKNCRSRSVSPASERSGSPNQEPANKTTEKTDIQKTSTRKSPLPLITVAPTAKLMKKRIEEMAPTQKSPETKKDVRNKMNLRKRRTSKCSATVTSQTARQRTATPKAQDLRMCSPSEGSSPASITNAIHSPPHAISQHPGPPPPQFPNPMFGMPPPMYVDHHDIRHQNIFPPRLNFMPRPGFPIHHERPRLPPPLNFPPPLGQAPPVTVLVPYPVVLPVPIPIPIPIPLTSFIQAHCNNKVKTERAPEDTEGPLDFTMNSGKRKEQSNGHSEPAETNTPRALDEQNDEFHERILTDDNNRMEIEDNETGNPEQTLPKFKITRLGNKMAKIVTKSREQAESTRPLRKRRRLMEVQTDDEALIPKTRKIVEV